MGKGTSSPLHHRGSANHCASIACPKAGWCQPQPHVQPLESICLTASLQGHPQTTPEPSRDVEDVLGAHTPPEQDHSVTSDHS